LRGTRSIEATIVSKELEMKKTKLAFIGCGAVTERCHLPAARDLQTCEVVMLVDRDKERAGTLAKNFQVPGISEDYRDVIGRIDAAVLALPHNLHAPVGLELLKAGIHVLVEKPMAMSSSECEAMIKASQDNKAILTVGLIRRFLQSALFAKEFIESGMLGRIESFDFREGNVYNWPVASDFLFRPETGGGALIDTGAHTLDLLIWWLGDVSLIDYFDDNYGGVEADCEISLKTDSGVEGVVEISRTRGLRNTAIIKGERGILEVDLRKNSLSLSTPDGQNRLTGHGQLSSEPDASNQGFPDLFFPQLKAFIDAIQKGTAPKVSGEGAAKSVRLIEKCYQERKPLRVPWLPAQPAVLKSGREQ
jgi:predicted dehydrogenase